MLVTINLTLKVLLNYYFSLKLYFTITEEIIDNLKFYN